jgi:uncharacterized protein (DUF2236 family)
VNKQMLEPIMPPEAQWASLAPHPGTITWQRADDARVLLAAGYALLLQVSHPTVGAGVSEHSNFRADPWGRLLRTLDYSCTMVYAGPPAAAEMGQRIRSFHRHIRGTLPDGSSYHALEPEAYAWVHATLAAGIVHAHARFAVALTAPEREQLWAEWRSLGRLLGIREGDLPPGWAGFEAYYEEMVRERLQHTAAVAEVLEALARPAAPAISARLLPLWPLARPQLGHVIRLTTLGLLPASLRARFGTRLSRREEIELAALSGALRAATPLIPRALRNTGPGYLRWRAEALARGEAASLR